MVNGRRQRRWAAIGLALITSAGVLSLDAQTPGRGAGSPTSPRLLVLVVVDQLRADYVDWYGSQWTRGFRRLMTGGALFPRAAYPYAITRTCAGHSSIATGVVPARHGMIDNDWYDAAAHKFVTCTLDPTVAAVGFGGKPGTEHHSAAALRSATIGDELLRQRPASRLVSIALKARSAISLAGHGGSRAMIVWEEDSGTWATSTAFTRTPWPEVDAFVLAHPTAAARGQTWARQLPGASYRNEDDGQGEAAPATFPHVLVAPPGGTFTAVWDMSPWSDAYLGEMAASLVDRLKLRGAAGPDLLAIGFSALDFVGHAYGPRSHEVQDLLVRLDGVIGHLLDVLDQSVGRDRYVLALTSDHGVALLPEQAAAVTGTPGGRVGLNTLGLAIEIALGNELGGRQFIEAITGSYVHFLPGVLDRIRGNVRVIRAVEAAATSVPGVERVYWSWDLSTNTPTTDTFLSGLRRSYVAQRSGDLAFLPRANWVVVGAGTQHGSMHPYDTEVPLMLFGTGIRPGRYTTGATPLDLAPTLAWLGGISLPSVDGRVLNEALAR